MTDVDICNPTSAKSICRLHVGASAWCW